MFTNKTRLILASASPRRSDLLGRFGFNFEVIPAKAAEPAPKRFESPEDFVARAAAHKAQAVQEELGVQDAAILSADTIVVLKDASGVQILEKPKSGPDAVNMLSQLSGKKHEVLTGFAIVLPAKGIAYQETVSTAVWFRSLSREEIFRYVETGEPMDKAGAYGIQGVGSFLVDRIEGCYFNVVGLPVSRVVEQLEIFEIIS